MNIDRTPTGEPVTANDCFVGVRGKQIVFPIMLCPQEMPATMALRLAAWIVAMSGVGREEFSELVDAIERT